jgi:NTE family protein
MILPDLGSHARPKPAVLRTQARNAPRTARSRIRRLSLALQGGGAFGAFTWGVLDRLLEEESVSFDAISGASAGAMNAVVLASGLAEGDREAAREGLERFWRKVSKAGRRSLFASCDTILSAVTQNLSPYQFNPLDLNPLRDILAEEIDFEALRRPASVRLLLGATRVKDGALRIFRNRTITPDVVLASACLPHLHQAVLIDGEPHWDGGYAANPPLMPLVEATRARDLLVVQIMPASSTELPTTPSEIDKRLNQITFNHSLQRDLEMLSLMKDLCLKSDGVESRLGRKLPQLELHRVSAEAHVEGLSGLSIKNTEWGFLTDLRDRGRSAAEAWLLESAFRSDATAHRSSCGSTA